MSKLYERIRQKRGETLIESMAAILIFTFASIALLTMLMTAGDLNETAAQWAEAQGAAMERAETGEGEGIPGSVTVTLHGDPVVVQVEVFGEGDGPYAYYPVWEGTQE